MRVFYDVDTQNDFMNKDGALYVPDAELIKPNLKMLTEFARSKAIPIIGSVDRHFGTEEYKAREGELSKWGGPFPEHCMNGKYGEKKIVETTWWCCCPSIETDRDNDYGRYLENVLDFNKIGFENNFLFATRLDFLSKKLRNKEQSNSFDPVYFEKQSYDVFTNPTLEVFLKYAGVKEAIVYGVATDFCVKAAVLGMQKRGIDCYVVEDAIKGVFVDSTKSALEEMTKAGAKFVTTKEILEGVRKW